MVFHVKAGWKYNDLKKLLLAKVVEPVIFLSRLPSTAEQKY